MPLFCERQADPAVSAEQMILHLNAESRLLVMCGLMDWTHVQCLPWQSPFVVTQSGRPTGDVCIHSDPHAPGTLQGAIICRNALLFCLWDASGSFHAVQVKEEFVEV